MMKKLLKKLSFVATVLLSVSTLQAQDPTAFLHMQFENNLNASTTESSGVVFEGLNATSLGYSLWNRRQCS